MNWGPLQLALRETLAVYRDRRALAAMALVGAILGLAGPFGTYEGVGPLVRIPYWIAVAVVTYGAGQLGATILAGWLVPEGSARWIKVVVMAIGAAVPVTSVVLLLNRLFFAQLIFGGWVVLELFAYCIAVSLAFVAMLECLVLPLLFARKPPASWDGPRLMARLPHHLRGPLAHMSMADHYVEVHTAKGSTLVLMRLADAIAETEGVAGLRIHRSHWVAADAVAGLERKDGKTFVALKSGTLLPVSRSYLEAARAAFG